MSEYTIKKQYIIGAPGTKTFFTKELAEKVYTSCSIYHQRTFWDFFVSTLWYYERSSHWEYAVVDEEGRTIAAMAFEEKYDFEAGRCIALINAFNTEPDKVSLAGGYRWMIEVARDQKVGTVINSKMVSNGRVARYDLRFIKIGPTRYGKL